MLPNASLGSGRGAETGLPLTVVSLISPRPGLDWDIVAELTIRLSRSSTGSAELITTLYLQWQVKNIDFYLTRRRLSLVNYSVPRGPSRAGMLLTAPMAVSFIRLRALV